MIAKYDIEAGVRKWRLFGIAFHERYRDALGGDQFLCMPQLLGRQIETGHSGAATSQRNGPLRTATSEFEDVFTGDIAQNAQFTFRNGPYAPSGFDDAQLRRVLLLIIRANLVPVRAILFDV